MIKEKQLEKMGKSWCGVIRPGHSGTHSDSVRVIRIFGYSGVEV